MMKKPFKTLLCAIAIWLLLLNVGHPANIVQLSPGYFPNSGIGRPLSNADIYVGKPDLDPEIVANQKQLSVQQENGTIVNVPQPISTSAGGVPQYLGSSVTLLVEGDYSLKVNNSSGSQIYYVPSLASQALIPGNFFYPDYTESDQGAAGDGNSVFDMLTEVGDVTKATMYFAHNSGSPTTTYTFGTSETITDNFNVIVEQGVILSDSGGSADLTINGTFEHGLSKCFAWTGSGSVSFGDGAVKEVYAEWWGAVGDNDGTADNGTDDHAAIQAAIDAYQIVKLLQKNYRISAKLNLTKVAQVFYGSGANYGDTENWNSALVLDSALSDYGMQCLTSGGGVQLHDFAIIGNDSTNSLGGLYLKDDGANGNYGNIIRNLSIQGFAKAGAYGIRIESWGTTIDTIYVRRVERGFGMHFGGVGISGTTQYINRAYIGDCDVGIMVRYTSLGVTFIDPILESCTVEYVQTGNQVVMINPYFENMNVLNEDGATRISLAYPAAGGVDVDNSIFVGGGVLTMIGANINTPDSVADSKILYVADGAAARIISGSWGGVQTAGQISAHAGGDLVIRNPIDFDFSLISSAENKSVETTWSNYRLRTYLPDSDKVTVAAAGTSNILADFNADIYTIYTFKVFSMLNNEVRSVNEIIAEYLGGVGYDIKVHNLYEEGGYTTTFAIVDAGGSKFDLTANNTHASANQTYKIMLMDTVRTQ